MTANIEQGRAVSVGNVGSVPGTAVVLRLPHRRSHSVRPPARKEPATVDPYMLVVLAQEERNQNRIEQAESLIEAAYNYYDRCNYG
jgi:hypothetical protein